MMVMIMMITMDGVVDVDVDGLSIIITPVVKGTHPMQVRF